MLLDIHCFFRFQCFSNYLLFTYRRIFFKCLYENFSHRFAGRRKWKILSNKLGMWLETFSLLQLVWRIMERSHQPTENNSSKGGRILARHWLVEFFIVRWGDIDVDPGLSDVILSMCVWELLLWRPSGLLSLHTRSLFGFKNYASATIRSATIKSATIKSITIKPATIKSASLKSLLRYRSLFFIDPQHSVGEAYFSHFYIYLLLFCILYPSIAGFIARWQM